MDLLIKAYCKPYRGQEDLPPLLEAAGLSGHLVDPKMNACQDTDTGLWVTGYLDECLETAEGFSPLDHKTRGYEVKQIYRGYQLQLDVYALLLERNGLKPNGIGVLVFYVPDDGAFENGVKFKLDVRTIAVSPANALKCVTNAREVLDLVTPPDSSQQCGYCHWATLTRS